MKAKGIIILIEGIDGSGKKTQYTLLKNWLKEKYPLKVIKEYDFPAYDLSFFGSIIGKYLKGEYGNVMKVDPFESALLYAGDRLTFSKQLQLDQEDANNIILLNRYVESNLCYGLAKLRLLNRYEEDAVRFINFIEKLEYATIGLPRPDVIVYLDVDVMISSRQVDQKGIRDYLGSQKKDEYESNQLLQEFARNEYLALALSSPPSKFHVIQSTNKSIEMIHKEIQIIAAEQMQDDSTQV